MDRPCGPGAWRLNAGWPVHHFRTIDSTNTEARRRAQAGDFEDCWIVADTQTAGRGRLQRVWESPEGNLFSTALFREPGGFAVAGRLPFAAALAVTDTALHFAPEADPRVKWPNDVRVAGAKLSGILIETGTDPAGGLWIAAGIGINVADAPSAAGQSATCLRTLAGGARIEAADVFLVLSDRFDRRLQQARESFSGVRTDWLARAEGLGNTVRVNTGAVPVEGVFTDMAADGAMIVTLPDGTRQTIRAGDVNLIGRT